MKIRLTHYEIVKEQSLDACLPALARDNGEQAKRVEPKNFGPERIRTADPLLAKQVLYQLSYRPLKIGGPKRNCTSDPSVISTVLC